MDVFEQFLYGCRGQTKSGAAVPIEPLLSLEISRVDSLWKSALHKRYSALPLFYSTLYIFVCSKVVRIKCQCLQIKLLLQFLIANLAVTERDGSEHIGCFS